jgi:hypothetical protein
VGAGRGRTARLRRRRRGGPGRLRPAGRRAGRGGGHRRTGLLLQRGPRGLAAGRRARARRAGRVHLGDLPVPGARRRRGGRRRARGAGGPARRGRHRPRRGLGRAVRRRAGGRPRRDRGRRRAARRRHLRRRHPGRRLAAAGRRPRRLPRRLGVQVAAVAARHGVPGGAPERLAHLPPLAAGWYAGEDRWSSIYDPPLRLAADARRLDLAPAWLCWGPTRVALELIEDLGVEAIHAHDVGLADGLRARLGMPAAGSAIVAVDVPARPDRCRAGCVPRCAPDDCAPASTSTTPRRTSRPWRAYLGA